jgi:hypothetical protein
MYERLRLKEDWEECPINSKIELKTPIDSHTILYKASGNGCLRTDQGLA